MNNTARLFDMIERGRLGKNIGLNTGIPKLDSYVGGVRGGLYTLIFGVSGSGKTAFALYSYIYRPLKDYADKDLKIVYYSLELSAELLQAKLLSLYIFEEYGRIIPFTKLMSWQEPLSDEDYNYVVKGRAWLDKALERLTIFDKNLTHKVFYHTLMTKLEEWGTFEEIEGGNRTIYKPNNPEQLVLVVIDHLGLCVPCDGHTKKIEMDLISQYCISIKERCQASFIVLQQENRNSANMDRRKAGWTECSSEDLKDTGNTFNDCDICIGVYYPLKFRVKTHLNYPIIAEETTFKGLRDRYRSLCLIKNRQGISERLIPVNFFGEVGKFQELPPVEKITDFSLYTKLKQSNDIQQKDEVSDETSDETKKDIIFSF